MICRYPAVLLSSCFFSDCEVWPYEMLCVNPSLREKKPLEEAKERGYRSSMFNFPPLTPFLQFQRFWPFTSINPEAEPRFLPGFVSDLPRQPACTSGSPAFSRYCRSDVD